MMKFKLMALSLLFFVTYGCNDTSTSTETEATVTETHESMEEDHSHDGDSGEIELNNGEKWIVNEEMKPHIQAGEKILDEYDGSDYKMLASRLKEKNSALIKSCTMEGKSHDELHKWLHPHLEMVDELNNADSEEEAEDVVAQLEKSYQSYHDYFK